MKSSDPVNLTTRHVSAIWVLLVAVVPVILGTIEYIYLPRFASAVEHTIQKEIRDPDNKVFIECLIQIERNKWQLVETTEDLSMFQAAVEAGNDTAFHRAEIRRLMQKQQLETGTVINDQVKPCSERH